MLIGGSTTASNAEKNVLELRCLTGSSSYCDWIGYSFNIATPRTGLLTFHVPSHEVPCANDCIFPFLDENNGQTNYQCVPLHTIPDGSWCSTMPIYNPLTDYWAFDYCIQGSRCSPRGKQGVLIFSINITLLFIFANTRTSNHQVNRFNRYIMIT